MEGLLNARDVGKFVSKINVLLSGFPYQLFSKADEHTFHGFLLSMLSGMGLRVAAETSSSLGRLDLLVLLDSTTYVMELKLDKSPTEGLQQIKEKKYYVPYLNQGKALALVGISFSSTARNIGSWVGELLDEHGGVIRALTPEDRSFC